MEQKLLEQVLLRFNTYMDHHTNGADDRALSELLLLSRDYLPEFTTLDGFIEMVRVNGTPNEHVNAALAHLLSHSSLFRIASERVLAEDDLAAEAQAEAGKHAEAAAAAQDALIAQVDPSSASPVVIENAPTEDSSDLFA